MPRTSRHMNLWLRQEAELEQKAQPPGYASYGWGGGPAFADAFRFRRAPSLPALAEAYKSLIFTCVRINADAVARVPLRLYRLGRSKGDRAKYHEARQATRGERLRLKSLSHTAKAMAGAEEVEEITGDHPLLKLINDVNPHMDHHSLINYTVMSMDVVGTGYWWPTEYTKIGPQELWALPPHLVYPEIINGLVPSCYRFGGVEYRPEDLLIFKHLSMKNPYGLGMSPTQAAIEYARLEDTFVSIQDDLLSNGPRPSVVVSHKDPKGAFGPAERQRLENDMNAKGRGGRAGGAFVVDGPVAVTPISWTPADLGAVEISKYDLERTCGCFGVPVSMVTNESSNMAVAREGLEQHARNAIEPRCKTIASVLTRWTHALDRSGQRNWSKLFWAFDDCVPEDKVAQAEQHRKYVDMGLPLNVALTEAGYDKVEGGDVSFVASGLQTIENAVKPPEPPQPPGGGEMGGDEDEEQEPADEGTKALMDLCGKVLAAIDEDIKASKPKKPKPEADKPAKKPKKPGGSHGAGTHAGCGTGAGGFKPGNTCATGGRGGAKPGPQESPPARSATDPVLRDRPIAERIAGWKEGDAKIKHLQSLGSKVDAARKAVDDHKAKYEALAADYKNARGKAKAEAKAKMEEAADEIFHLGVAKSNAEREAREAAQSILESPRPLQVGLSEGAKGNLSEHQLNSTQEGISWLKRCVSHPEGMPPLELNVRSLAAGDVQRSNCERDAINLDLHVDPATAVHEIGHHFDFHVPWVDGRAREFFHHRAGDEQPSQLRSVMKGKYTAGEYGRKDNFDKAFGDEGWYVGKKYDDGMTEITSMGLEKMYKDPVGFATKDPEYAKYILGIMHGPLR